MENIITYQIPLTPENSEKIDAINRILIDGYSQTTDDTPAKQEKPKVSKPAKKAEPETDDGMTFDEFKDHAKKVKKDFGEDFAMQVLTDTGIDVNSTLGRSLSKVDAEQYEAIVEAWQEGPSEDDEDLDDDDDFLDDEDEEEEVDATAVKTALRAYNKENGRKATTELMSKYKVEKLSDVDDMKPAAMAKLFAELV